MIDCLKTSCCCFVIVGICVRRKGTANLAALTTEKEENNICSLFCLSRFYSLSLSLSLSYISMAAGNVPFKSSPKQMSDSWIVIDDQDESDFVVIEDEHANSSLPYH